MIRGQNSHHKRSLLMITNSCLYPNPLLFSEPYDDDTFDSDSEEEYDDSNPQKPCYDSEEEESDDEKNPFIHPEPSYQNSIKKEKNGHETNFKKSQAESASDDEFMSLSKPTTLSEPYDDDTFDTDPKEEFDDSKPQKPCSDSEEEEFDDEKNPFIHSQPSSHLMIMRFVSHLVRMKTIPFPCIPTIKHVVVVVQKLETLAIIAGSKKQEKIVVSKIETSKKTT
ncbi:hypothetical protein ACFE04_020653 [Oxalis oulophora]